MVTNPKLPSSQQTVPILESGDHLTRAEFERRYSRMPEVKKAELIEGIVQRASPVRGRQHGKPHALLMWWLTHYSVVTNGTDVADNATLRLDLDNESQPDALMYQILSGKLRLSEEGYFEGAPELVAEVAASSVSIDLHAKLKVYRRNQVEEYIVWRVEEGKIDWFALREGEYVPLPLNAGIYRSEVFPGLWLDTDALIGEESLRVFRVLQEGLDSPEHAAFVLKLQQAEQERKERETGPNAQ